MTVEQDAPSGAGGDLEVARAHPTWLALREPADAMARSRRLVRDVLDLLPADGVVVHDLGCGTGSMGRWLAPLLPGAQHWVLHDRDPELLGLAMADPPRAAADGSAVTTEVRPGEITRLDPAALEGASLVTASALLDMLDAPGLELLLTSCVDVRCPVLITLSVVGRVELWPPDPLDPVVMSAFNDHQRRWVAGRRLLGPDAVGAGAAVLRRCGLDVRTEASPWLLGPEQAALVVDWFDGWFGAAVEQEQGLSGSAGDYVARRRAEAAAGRLRVTVHHEDLLAVPRGARAGAAR